MADNVNQNDIEELLKMAGESGDEPTSQEAVSAPEGIDIFSAPETAEQPELTALQTQNELLQQQLAEKEKEIEELKKELEALKQEAEAVKSEKAELSEKISKLEEEMEQLKESQTQTPSEPPTELTEKLQSLEQENNELKSKLQELEVKITQLETEKTQLLTQLQEAQSQSQSTDTELLTQLQAKISELETQNSLLQQQIDLLNKQLQEKQLALINAEGKIRELEAQAESQSGGFDETKLIQIVNTLPSKVDGWVKNLLTTIGIETIDPVGMPFDPNIAEQVGVVRIPSMQEGTVASVQEVGYKVNGKLIKKAKVIVVKNSISCPVCGWQITENAKFCPNCGSKIETSTQDPEALVAVADLLFEKGLIDKALETYKEIASNNPNPEITVKIVRCYEKLGRFKEAVKEVSKLSDDWADLKEKITAKYAMYQALLKL